MTDSKTGETVPRKGQFKRGDDPRRNHGHNSKKAQAWGMLFKNALAEKLKPAEVAEILAEQVRRGRPWAVELYLDRMVGKPKENEGEPNVYVVKYADEPNEHAGS